MQQVQNIIDENGYQFFTCYKCGNLISAIELTYALNTTGIGCRCGCMKVQPVQVKLEQYSQRNVVEMAIFLKFDEAAYIADFLMETSALNWPVERQNEEALKIKDQFKTLLGELNEADPCRSDIRPN